MADMSSLTRKVEARGGFIARRLRLDLSESLNSSAAAAGHHRTGKMIEATKVTDVRISPTTWRITAVNPTIQAATTNYGARPHVIEPRSKKALAFTARGGNRVVVRRVNHPGNRPSHWFDRVMNRGYVNALLVKFVGR